MRAFSVLCAIVPLAGGMAIASHTAERHNAEAYGTGCSYLSKHVLGHIPSVTQFCSSYLSVHRTASRTTVYTTTSLVTTVTTSTTTSVVFSSGQPPAIPPPKAQDVRMRAIHEYGNHERSQESGLPSESEIMAACSCLDLPLATGVSASSCEVTTTLTETRTTTIYYLATSTTTVYPCATPFPTKIPTIPYGIGTGGEYTTHGNDRFDLSTPIGATAISCCNACYFELENCIQAFWYSYQGCVVMQPASYNSTGVGISGVCPRGRITGLRYLNDTRSDFRNTGDIAGPCGEAYENL